MKPRKKPSDDMFGECKWSFERQTLVFSLKSSVKTHESVCFPDVGSQPDVLNKKAIAIVNRVRDKLTGGFACQQ